MNRNKSRIAYENTGQGNEEEEEDGKRGEEKILGKHSVYTCRTGESRVILDKRRRNLARMRAGARFTGETLWKFRNARTHPRVLRLNFIISNTG